MLFDSELLWSFRKYISNFCVLFRVVNTFKIPITDFNSTEYPIIDFPGKMKSLHIFVLIRFDHPIKLRKYMGSANMIHGKSGLNRYFRPFQIW